MKAAGRTVALALAAALACVASSTAPASPAGTGRVAIRGDEPTLSGAFDGTWMYVNRDAHYAMWIRTRDGKPQVRIQYQSLASPEAFETDWAGRANYYMAGKPGTFSLTLDRAEADVIVGRWAWELAGEGSARRESATVTVRRTGYGRTLEMDFQGYERTVTAGPRGNVLKGPMAWTWVKISKRELLWDELPW